MEMILILVALVIATVAVIALFVYAGDGFQGMHFFASLLGVLGAVVVIITAISYVCWGSGYFGAAYKAEIINNEYGTSYTQAQVFWASDVIDTVRELDRKRIEVNGDLFREEVEEN